MPYTAPTTRATSNLITATIWNTDLVDNITYLANPPACRVYHNTTQSIPHITLTKLSFNSERFDTNTMHDTVTNNSRITFNTAGLYIVGFCFEMVGGADYNMCYGDIYLNNTTALVDQRSRAGANSQWGASMTTVYKFAVADYIEARVYHDNAALAARNSVVTNNSNPEFWAVWIGLG